MKPEGHGPTCFCSDCREAEGGDLPQTIDNLIEEVKEKIRSITYYVKENVEMLPTEGSESKTTSTKKTAGGKTFLRPEHLSTTPKEFKIIDLRYDGEGKFGPKVQLKLVGEGRTFFWDVSIKKNPNYRTMLKKFGREENNWTQQKILLLLEQDSFDDQYYIHVDFPPPGRPSSRRGSAAEENK